MGISLERSATFSLLCTAKNSTPHSRIFSYPRKSAAGTALPEWLSNPGSTILMRRHDRNSKYEPHVDRVELLNCNPQYAQVRLQNGRETSVSLRDLAPLGEITNVQTENTPDVTKSFQESETTTPVEDPVCSDESSSEFTPRRSSRISRPPERLQY